MPTKKNATRAPKYRVESEAYPSGMGCYAGEALSDDYIDACTTVTVVGEYDTLAKAKKAAIAERNSTCAFDDWAEDYYDGAGPPFFSSDGDNPDDDDTWHIYIVDIAKENAKKAKDAAEKENMIQKARNAKPKKKQKASSTTRKFGPQKGNFKPDTQLFLRNPSGISGAETHAPQDYTSRGTGKNSFVYLIQKLSDRNYTMRGVCLDGSGAPYTSHALPKYPRRSVHFLPDTNLDDHSSDDTIVDTFHTDLFHPKTGEHVLTVKSLSEAVTPEIECLFLTNLMYREKTDFSKAIVKAIQTCSANLKCITLSLSPLTVEILEALATCKNLCGILLQDPPNYTEDDKAVDKALARVLSSCSLKWIYVDYVPFHESCWNALAAGACPDLEVLWVDQKPNNPSGRICYTVGDHPTIRRILTERNLKICMINPDEKLKSSYIPADGDKKAYDRLTGKKEPKFEFDDFCDYY